MKNSAPAGIPVRIQRENLERLRNFCLLDDDFFTKCFEENPECVELVLRIVLEVPDLVVLDVRTQVFLANLLDRSVRLEVLATDADGKKYNITVATSDGMEQIIIRGAGCRLLSSRELQEEIEQMNEKIKTEYMEVQPENRNFLKNALSKEAAEKLESMMKKP